MANSVQLTGKEMQIEKVSRSLWPCSLNELMGPAAPGITEELVETLSQAPPTPTELDSAKKDR